MTAVSARPHPEMSATGAGVTAVALVPAILVVLASVFVGSFAGHPDRLGGAYALLMNLGVLLRGFGMFVAVLVVWGPLRSRRASRPILALALLSGPLAYGVVAAIGASGYFPLGQAAYYGVNPMTIAAIAAQCAVAALGESLWRAWSLRQGRSEGRPVTWRLAAVFVGGLATVFFTVLYDGGVPFFYIYQSGYMLLFV